MTIEPSKNENEKPVRDPSSAFDLSLEMLELHRGEVPKGWTAIYDRALAKLRAVQCEKRNHTKLSMAQVLDAEMRITLEVEFCGRADPVILGILHKLRKQSRSMCERCGRMGAIEVTQAWASVRLCVQCEVAHQIRKEWQEWVQLLNFGRRAINAESIVELHSLPLTLRTLIPRRYVRTLSAKDDSRVEYLMKDDLREMLPMIERVLAHVNDSG